MISVGEVLLDPDFSQDFTVHRRTGTWQAGNFIETESALTFTGVVIPPSAKEIVQIPEADRATGLMNFYASEEMHVTRNTATDDGTSDQIEWRGSRYRIFNVVQLVDYGYYKATGVYLGSN